MACLEGPCCFSLQLVDLKAALFSKQREAGKEKRQPRDEDALSTRRVSDKVQEPGGNVAMETTLSPSGLTMHASAGDRQGSY